MNLSRYQQVDRKNYSYGSDCLTDLSPILFTVITMQVKHYLHTALLIF